MGRQRTGQQKSDLLGALRSLWQQCLKGGDGWQRGRQGGRNRAGSQFGDYPLVQVRGQDNLKGSIRNEDEGLDEARQRLIDRVWQLIRCGKRSPR